MAKIRWTSEAITWLQDIYNYIANDNPAAAGAVVDGIYEKTQLLRLFPEIGYKYRTEPDGDIRILLYGHYRIAYLLSRDRNIDVLGVYHGALDLDQYLP